ncbi:MAG: dihydrodipicolinate synthase family protein [Deltaproteobacteria bacterium]|nr:dihydrodipicolinate synthase family protein [Deltaproteobacteria bacterium]
MSALVDAFARLQPGRRVHGISAVLLPYMREGEIDWQSFEAHLWRTRQAGLDVAVNMDTGFVDLLSEAERDAVLATTRRILGSGTAFYAGAFSDGGGTIESYHRAIAAIETRGGTPVIIQSRAMHGMGAADKAALYASICARCETALAFELGPMFAPHGEIWDDETFLRLLEIPNLQGSKHSSLDRNVELRRLAARDRKRADFRIYTGNDLAIDMVVYGSDYLLGLSTFAPEKFAARDAALAGGSMTFLTLNDALQHLGNVGFRIPVAAYKHAAAQYLHLTGALPSDAVHPRALQRPGSDRILLLDCAVRLGDIDDPERTYRERVVPYL